MRIYVATVVRRWWGQGAVGRRMAGPRPWERGRRWLRMLSRREMRESSREALLNVEARRVWVGHRSREKDDCIDEGMDGGAELRGAWRGGDRLAGRDK